MSSLQVRVCNYMCEQGFEYYRNLALSAIQICIHTYVCILV